MIFRRCEIKAKQVKQALASVGLSLLTAIGSSAFVIILGGLYGDLLEDKLPALCSKIGEGLLYLMWAIIIAVACYFICRSNPKSIWYAPILCNIMGIIAAFIEPTFWITSLGIFMCGGWALSLIAAISGAKAGKRSISNAS